MGLKQNKELSWKLQPAQKNPNLSQKQTNQPGQSHQLFCYITCSTEQGVGTPLGANKRLNGELQAV
jgi:hypothetical protein